jgi:hypothetical protein
LVIVAISYDAVSLNRRMETLQRLGHIVVPASSLATGRHAIERTSYHLLLIGATVAPQDRHELANMSRTLRPGGKIISVENPGASPLKLADRMVMAGDEAALLVAITSLISGGAESDLEAGRR